MVLASSMMASGGIDKVKAFELEHAKKLNEQANILKDLANDYYHDIKLYYPKLSIQLLC